MTAQKVADNLLQDDNGYVLTEDIEIELQNTNGWAIFIDNATMNVVWQTDNLPETRTYVIHRFRYSEPYPWLYRRIPHIYRRGRKWDLWFSVIRKTVFGNICGRVGIII